MDFIANLSKAQDRRRGSLNRFQALEVLFRKVCDHGSDSITLEQFQKIVKSKNTFFVERIFKIFDLDNSNVVSKDEVIRAVKDIVRRNADEKLFLLFQIYDLDGDNQISLEELRHVIKCCMDENGLQFSATDIEYLTLTLFDDADRNESGNINFNGLKKMFARNEGLIENMAISMDRWLLPPLPSSSDSKSQQQQSFRRKLKLSYIANNAVSFSFLIGFLLVNIGLFVSRLYSYRESSIFYMFSRACALCLNFCCSFTLALMLRKCITTLRSSGVSEYLPLDQHIYYHKLTGIFIVLYSVIHGSMHVCNFNRMTYLSNVPLAEYLFSANQGVGWFYGSAAITGWFLLVILFIMGISSMNFVRRSGCFEIFYYCHLLYIPFYLILLLHGPNFWKWLLAPAIVFGIEVLIRVKNSFGSRGYTYIQQGTVLPSRVIHLVIKRPPGFDFRPGDWVFVQIPEIAKAEWHPFTISSAPEMNDVIWLHIRAVGEWTNRVLDYFLEQEKLVRERNRRRCLHGMTYDETLVAPTCDYIPSITLNMPTIEEIPLTPILPAENRQERLFGGLNVGFENTGFESNSRGRAESEVNSTDISVLIQDRRSSMSRQFSTPNPNRGKETDVSNVRLRKCLSSGGNQRRAGLSRTMSKVYVLPRPADCDEYACKKNGQSSNAVMRAKNYGEISSMLSMKRKESVAQGNNAEKKERVVNLDRPLHLHLDGPYGSPSSHIFSTQHAVLVATGIGVTPFASILQSIMFRYVKAKNTCPKCEHSWADPEPPTMMRLRKVDFVWINRDQKSFEWFVNLLSELEITQAQLNEAERFLDIHMYISSALDKSDMKAIGLQMALDLMHEKEKRDLITGLKTRTQPGRPNWDELFKAIAAQNKGRVSVFFCGSPELGRTLHSHCIPRGFDFRKENF